MSKLGNSKLISLFFLIIYSLNIMATKTDNFINSYAKASINEAIRTGIPASITMAQAILESGWGESGLAKVANNFFGIKADSSWKGPVYNGATHEVYDGKTVYLNDDFRKYNSPKESFKDHSDFLVNMPRYDNIFKYSMSDYKNWAKGLKASGYATSPTYDTKLIGVIEQYGLSKLDEKAQLKRNLNYIIYAVLIVIGLVALYKLIMYLNK